MSQNFYQPPCLREPGSPHRRPIAFCDTEFGTAFYGQEGRSLAPVHPKAFDFDVLYTKSITEVLDAVRGLDPAVYGVIVIDSISHLWDACRNAYKGKLTKAGTIPYMHGLGSKKPYIRVMHVLLSSPLHVLICGRQGNDFGEDDRSGEMKNLGYKMRAEGKDACRPDVLVRLEAASRARRRWRSRRRTWKKDRTGVLAGQSDPLADVRQPWPVRCWACWVRRRRRAAFGRRSRGVQDAEAAQPGRSGRVAAARRS